MHKGEISHLRVVVRSKIIDEHVKGGYDGKVQVNVSGTPSNTLMNLQLIN